MMRAGGWDRTDPKATAPFRTGMPRVHCPEDYTAPGRLGPQPGDENPGRICAL